MRDMVPNHLPSVALLPGDGTPELLCRGCRARREKPKFCAASCRSVRFDVLRFVAFGRAVWRRCIDGKPVVGYRAEPHVGARIDDGDLCGDETVHRQLALGRVPLYLRTGKRMTRRLTEIVVQFKQAPFMLFRKTQVDRLAPNVLVIRIQPDEGICLRFDAKVPGPTVRIGGGEYGFSVRRLFRECATNRLRNAAPRRHGRRRDAVSTGGQY